MDGLRWGGDGRGDSRITLEFYKADARVVTVGAFAGAQGGMAANEIATFGAGVGEMVAEENGA